MTQEFNFDNFSEMTVSGLIKELQKEDENKKVILVCYSESYGMSGLQICHGENEDEIHIVGL